MPRIARITESDFPHHVVQRGNNKQVVFFDDNDRRFYLELVRRYTKECGCSIHAYCLMNNHIHMLLVPLCDDALSKTMQKLSLRYTQYVNKKYKRTGRLWECRYYSSLIEKDSYLWAVCRYIERNPVRARIVKSPELYEWSSAGTAYSPNKEHSFIEPIWHNDSEREGYLEFLNLAEKQSEIKAIRAATHRGAPIGTEAFLEMVSDRFSISLIGRPRGRPKKIN